MSVMVAGANDLSSSLAYTGICRSWQVSHSVQPQCGCSLRLWACEEQLFLSLVVLTGKQQLLGAAIMCQWWKSCLGFRGQKVAINFADWPTNRGHQHRNSGLTVKFYACTSQMPTGFLLHKLPNVSPLVGCCRVFKIPPCGGLLCIAGLTVYDIGHEWH